MPMWWSPPVCAKAKTSSSTAFRKCGRDKSCRKPTCRQRRAVDMISDIFIDRPRLAFVVSIVITLAGLLAIRAIPVAQFPDIVPPQVSLTTLYPGADAEVVETTVA